MMHEEKKVAKIVENENVKTYYLEADHEKGTKALAYFSAGQYLSIELEIGPMKLSRPYSLASSQQWACQPY